MTRCTTQDFIELEDEYGAHNYHPLDVVIERAEGVLGLGRRRQAVPRLPRRLLGGQPGALPPDDPARRCIEQAHKVTLTSRAFRNDQLPLLYKELHDLTGYRHGAADELRRRGGRDRASRRRASGATRSRASPTARPRSSSARTTSTAARSRSSASRPRRSTATASGRSRPGFKIVPVRRRRRRSRRRSRRTPARSWSSRSRARPASSCRRPASCSEAGELVPQAQRAVHGRRDPVGPRPHRQAVRLQARGRPARRA